MEQVKEHYQDLKTQLETKVRRSEDGHRDTERLFAACWKASLDCARFCTHMCALDSGPHSKPAQGDKRSCGNVNKMNILLHTLFRRRQEIRNDQ